MRIVCIGLDGAGKTTIINKVRGIDSIAQPTTGFNVESVSTSKKWEFSVIDVSGAPTTRALWRHQYHDVAAVVFVVDSADKGRLAEATKELESAMKDNELRGLSVLLYGNKQDVDGAANEEELKKTMNLQENFGKDRKWHVQLCSGISGQGISEGLAWLEGEKKRQMAEEKKK